MMTNQQIVDKIDDSLPSNMTPYLREKILDAVWEVLIDVMGIDLIEGRLARTRKKASK
jgi:hypothetical protein